MFVFGALCSFDFASAMSLLPFTFVRSAHLNTYARFRCGLCFGGVSVSFRGPLWSGWSEGRVSALFVGYSSKETLVDSNMVVV